jgi:hypothetical protein
MAIFAYNIYNCTYTIHNGSVVGIVTLNRLRMVIEWAKTCCDYNKNVINTLYNCCERRFYSNNFDKDIKLFFSPNCYISNMQSGLKFVLFY